MKADFHNLDDIYIITYYGVGGIGKSTLIKKLIAELKDAEENPYFVKYDFESAVDAKSVLTMIKTKLETDYKFTFPLFDLALYAYAKKIGENMEKPEIKALTEKSKVLSLIMDGMEEVPVVGLAAKLFRLADSSVALFKSNIKQNKNELLKIENESAEETLLRLPYYFSQDLNVNMENIDKPLVIFLDTYEKLVNEVKAEGLEITNDLWLRDDNGPIVQVPGVLWVIAGREKIKWELYDKEWADTLDQHILGDLSFKDASTFLKEAGLSDEKLIQDIYNLTNGTPVYLDICVSTYEILEEKSEEITIDKFGKTPEVLVERFIRYMDYQSSELVYMLSVIGTFYDSMIMEVAKTIIANFSLVLYEKIKNLSFVCTANNSYYIHKTVNHIFRENCPQIIKEKTNQVMYDYYYNFIITNSKLNEHYSSTVKDYFNTLLHVVNDNNKEKVLNEVFDVFAELERNALYQDYIKYAKWLYNQNIFVKTYIIKIIYAKALYHEGQIAKAALIFEEVLDYLMTFENTLEYDYTLEERYSALAIDNLRFIYNNYPNYQMIKKIITYMEKHFQDDEDFACNSLAYFYHRIGNDTKAMALYKRLLANDDVNCQIVALTSLLKCYSLEEDLETYLGYLQKMENLINHKDISAYNYLNSCLCLSEAYLAINLDKALMYINKAEEYMKINDYTNYDLLYSSVKFKLTILSKTDSDALTEYAKDKYAMLKDEIDVNNINNVNTLLALLRYFDDKEYYQVYQSAIDNFQHNLPALYALALANQNDLNLVKQCTDLILKNCDNLTIDNLEIIKKTVLDLAQGLYSDKIINDLIVRICTTYEKEFIDRLLLIPIYEEFMKFYYSIRNIDQALKYAEKKKKLIQKYYGTDALEYAESLYECAIMYYRLNNDNARKYSLMAKPIFEKNNKIYEVVSCEILIIRNNYPNKNEKIRKLEELYHQHQNNKSIASHILSNIVYDSIDENITEEELKVCQVNYDLFKENFGENNKETLKSLSDLGCAYYYLGNSSKALEILNQAKDGFDKYCTKYNNDAKINLENIVEICYQEAMYELLLENAFTLLDRYNLLMESEENKAQLLYYIADSYFHLDNFAACLKYGVMAHEKVLSDKTMAINNLWQIIISSIRLNKDCKLYVEAYLQLYDEKDLYYLTLLRSIYINLGELDKSLEISTLAYELAKGKYGDTLDLIDYIENVINDSEKLEKFDLCIQKEDEAYQIYKTVDIKKALNHLIAKDYYLIKNKNSEKAIELSDMIIKKFTEIDVKNRDYLRCINNIIPSLAKIDLKKAKTYYELALTSLDLLDINDSLRKSIMNKSKYFNIENSKENDSSSN